MSQKYHINAKGVPAPCKATKGNCPYGGDDGNENHFDSIEEAQEEVTKRSVQEFSVLPGVNDLQSDKFNYSQKELAELEGRHVRVEFDTVRENGEGVIGRIDGEVVKTNFNNDSPIHEIEIQAEKKWETHNPGKKVINTNILHKVEFRDDKFNLSKSEMDDLVNKEVSLKYDGKEINGKVDKIYYMGDRSFHERTGIEMNGLIIKDKSGKFNHIKLNRLTELNVNK